MDSLAKTHLVVEAVLAKKAQDIIILDLRGLTLIADYFVIATVTSAVQSHAIVDSVETAAKQAGERGVRTEGVNDVSWVLVDLSDVILHLFDAEHRDFYQLARLWADAPRVPLPEESAP